MAAFIGLTLTIPHPSAEVIASGTMSIKPFTLMLILFWITAFASATHDVAADGYYMLVLAEKQQSFFVGIRSLFYRLSSIFGQGGLIALAGVLEVKLGAIPTAWQMTLLAASILFAALTLWHVFALPNVETCEKGEGDKKRSGKAVLLEFLRAFKPLCFFIVCRRPFW